MSRSVQFERWKQPAGGNAFISLMGSIIVCIGCSSDKGTPPIKQPIAPRSGDVVRPQEEKLPFHESMSLEKDVIKRLYKICDNLAAKGLLSKKLADYCQENIKREYDKIMNDDLLNELSSEEKKLIHEAIVKDLGIDGDIPFLERDESAQRQALEIAAQRWVIYHAFEGIREGILSKAKAINDAWEKKDIPTARRLIISASDELQFIANAKYEDMSDPRIKEIIKPECKKAGIDYPAEGFIFDALRDLRNSGLEDVHESVKTLEKLIKNVPDT